MFKLDQKMNRIAKLEKRNFSELNLRERDNLQEWLANLPDALGEELLIIQKEFDGFDGTRERLDLLALDKEGTLVVIENKLDDTGRDVVWQALKYVAYCSSLSKSQIISIFQDYLNRFQKGGDASQIICDFLNIPEIDEVVLNSGTNQRFILVAANFRKEVTATVLWLLENGLRGQCFKVTPYVLDQELLLDINQIIPTPEAQEYMIGISSKGSEEKQSQGIQRHSEKLRLKFWEIALEELSRCGITTFQNISPGRDNWLSAGSGLNGCPYTLIFGKSDVRVEFNMNRSNQEENKKVFDFLFAQKEQIENDFGHEITWDRLDLKKSSRLKYSKKIDGYDEANWPEMVAWLAEHLIKLEKAIAPHIKGYKF